MEQIPPPPPPLQIELVVMYTIPLFTPASPVLYKYCLNIIKDEWTDLIKGNQTKIFLSMVVTPYG